MNTDFPRITLPGVDPESRDLVQTLVRQAAEVDETLQRNRLGMAHAMQRLGYRPYLGHVFRRPKATRHVRHMARTAARSTKAVSA